MPPRRRYSWEDEAGIDGGSADLEPARPDEVPVIWRRSPTDEAVVLRFRPRRDGEPASLPPEP